MSDDQERDEAASEGGREEESPASTPFDNPFFLPAVLWALALWFGWDIVTDAEAYQEWPWFNRIGGIVSAGAAAWFTRSAVLEKRDSA